METKDLLFEIGVEDLPPKNLNSFLEKIKKNIEANLSKESINFSECKFFYTNLRLIFVLQDVITSVNHEKKLIKGPPLSKCFDEENKLTKTGSGFAKKHNISFDQLKKLEKDGVEYVFYEKPKFSQHTKDLLPSILENSLIGVEEQKKMKWGKANIFFIRPIRWMLLFFGDECIQTSILNIKTKNYTYGPRWLSKGKVIIKNQDQFFLFLKDSKIIFDQEQRKRLIEEKVIEIIKSENCEEIIETELIDELSCMTESPYLYLGNFPKKYLDLPEKVLEYVIQDTQKHFLLRKDGNIINKFIGLSSIEINKELIRGNETVINPRLDDAKFFITKDLSNNIFNKKEDLKKVIFHKKLGSVHDKIKRLAILAEHINKYYFMNNGKYFIDLIEICKLDLISNMVVEMPKLQGYIGSYYAQQQGFNEKISDGISQHYLPVNPEDQIPRNIDAQIVSIADKLDTVVGIFLANEKPTGTRDPLGVRRSTNGLIRVLLEGKVHANIYDLIDVSKELFSENYKNLNQDLNEDCKNFFKEKLFFILKDDFKFNDSEIKSVLWYSNYIDPYTMFRKVSTIHAALKNSDFIALFSNAKRISNILKKSKLKISHEIDENLLRESSEKILYNEVNDIRNQLDSYLSTKDYEKYLNHLNILNKHITNFFDEVIVNADEEDVRLNRLSLLAKIENLYNQIGNIATLNT